MEQARRIEELDALRGLAALVVFNSHCVLVLAAPPPWLAAVLRSPLAPFLLGGHEAVLFFFLLSGFVLYLPYTRGAVSRPYLPYLVKRVCRICLPYLAGVAFVAAAYALFFRARPLPGISPYFSWAPMSRGEFWRLLGEHIAFLGSFHRERWNSSTWTLAEEMRISFFSRCWRWRWVGWGGDGRSGLRRPARCWSRQASPGQGTTFPSSPCTMQQSLPWGRCLRGSGR